MWGFRGLGVWGFRGLGLCRGVWGVGFLAHLPDLGCLERWRGVINRGLGATRFTVKVQCHFGFNDSLLCFL